MGIKFIIIKDKQGILRHFKSDVLHHSQIAREQGYNYNDILESGLFIDSQIFILESQSQRHLIKHLRHYIGNILDKLNPNSFDIRLRNWLRARELESQFYYSREPIGLREGD
jgi:hypothetical protein